MIETKELELNGSTYLVTEMTARRALRMQARLLKLLGPAASAIFLAAAKDVDSADDSIPNAITHLVDQLDEKSFESLVMELMQGVRKDNMELTPAIIDLEFAGDLNSLFLVLKFILEVNFGSFFSEGGILTTMLPVGRTNQVTAESTQSLAKT